jgi:hypothetical protein
MGGGTSFQSPSWCRCRSRGIAKWQRGPIEVGWYYHRRASWRESCERAWLTRLTGDMSIRGRWIVLGGTRAMKVLLEYLEEFFVKTSSSHSRSPHSF